MIQILKQFLTNYAEGINAFVQTIVISVTIVYNVYKFGKDKKDYLIKEINLLNEKKIQMLNEKKQYWFNHFILDNSLPIIITFLEKSKEINTSSTFLIKKTKYNELRDELSTAYSFIDSYDKNLKRNIVAIISEFEDEFMRQKDITNHSIAIFKNKIVKHIYDYDLNQVNKATN